MESVQELVTGLFTELGWFGGSMALFAITICTVILQKYTQVFSIIRKVLRLGSGGPREITDLEIVSGRVEHLEGEIRIMGSKVNTLQCLGLSGLEMSSNGVMLCDDQGQVLWVNNRLSLHMCHTNKGQFYGSRWLALVHSDDKQRVRQEFDLAVEEMGDIKDLEFKLKANGNYETAVLTAWITKEDPMNPEVNGLRATGWIVHIYHKDRPRMTNHAISLQLKETREENNQNFERLTQALKTKVKDSELNHRATREGVEKLARGAGLGDITWQDSEGS